jgi:hypothetical protein
LRAAKYLSYRRQRKSMEFPNEIVHFFFRSLLSETILLLQFPDELVELVVREFPPLFSDRTFELGPVPFHLIPSNSD